MNRLSFDFLACTDNKNWLEFPPKRFISKSCPQFGFEWNKACLMAKFLFKNFGQGSGVPFLDVISREESNVTSQIRVKQAEGANLGEIGVQCNFVHVFKS